MKNTLIAFVLTVCTSLCFSQPRVTLVVGGPPGGPSDAFGRATADYLKRVNDNNIVVSNKAGASGLIALRSTLEDPGFNILVASTGPFVFNRVMIDKLDIEPLQEFDVFGPVVRTPMALVTQSSGKIKTIADWKKQDHVVCGVTNQSGALWARLLFKKIGVPSTIVMYKGSPQLIQDILSKTLDCGLDSYPTYTSLHTSEHIKILAVADTQRPKDHANIPTIKELGVDFEAYSWFGIGIPNKHRGTDEYNKIARALTQIHLDSEFTNKMNHQGYRASRIGENYNRTLQQDYEYWNSVRQQFNLERTP